MLTIKIFSRCSAYSMVNKASLMLGLVYQTLAFEGMFERLGVPRSQRDVNVALNYFYCYRSFEIIIILL